jgi:hypothetical protein
MSYAQKVIEGLLLDRAWIDGVPLIVLWPSRNIVINHHCRVVDDAPAMPLNREAESHFKVHLGATSA